MKWTLDGGVLEFRKGGAGTPLVSIQCPNGDIEVDRRHELIPGLCEFRLTGKASLKVDLDSSGAITLTVIGDGNLEVVLYPVIPLTIGDGQKDFVCWPITTAGEGGLVLSASLGAGFQWTLNTKSFLDSVAALLTWSPVEAVTSLFKRKLLRLGELVEELGDLHLTGLTPVFKDGGVHFEKVEMKLGGKGTDGPRDASHLTMTLEKLSIDSRDMKVHLEEGALSARLESDAFVCDQDDKPVTLKFHKGSTFKFYPVMTAPRLEVEPPQGQPAITVFIPGCEQEKANELDGSQKPKNSENAALSDRFVLDLMANRNSKADGNGNGALKLDANGLTGTAEARLLPFKIGNGERGLDCAVTEGAITFNAGSYEARITASARLPYFKHGEGVLSVRSATGAKFSARWEMSPGQVWKDPTGHLEVHDPKAALKVEWVKGRWTVSGTVGGRLQLVRSPRFVGDAGRWLKGFADKFRLEFSELNLADLGGKNMRVRLRPLAPPRNLDFWGLFKLNLRDFELLAHGFAFGGEVGFNRNGLSFQGSFPRLGCNLSVKDGIRISTAPGDRLSISGQLTTPGGIKARMAFRRHTDGTVDELVGAGTLSIPGMPSISVLCMLGKRPNKQPTDPVFLLYAEIDIPIPLFPGVVLREVGLGFGINKVLAAVNDTPPQAVVSRLMNSSTGLPDAGAAESWATSEEGFDLSLVGQAAIAPATRGDGPFPYVGRSILYARPTNEFVILFGSSLWLLTGLDDSRTPEFRARPAMKGAMVLYPRHGYLEIQARTERRPRMSREIELVQKAFNMASGEFYLKASRDEFLFRAGPLRAEMSLLGMTLKGQIVHAVYVGSKGAITVLQAALDGRASIGWEKTLRFGPLSVTAGFRFTVELAFETVLAGMYLAALKSPALYARARVYVMVELAVWLRIEFRLVIKFWRFRKTISWSRSLRANLRLSVDLRLELVISSNPAMYGLARVEVRLFGYTFKPQLEIGKREHRHLQVSREHLSHLLTP